MQATQTRKLGLVGITGELVGIYSIILYFTAIRHIQHECPPSAWHEEWYLPVKDTVQSTWGATLLPRLLLGTIHQHRALTPGSSLPPAPSLKPQAPASLPIENGGHSSWSQPPPSSPWISSIMFGDCKHPETRLTHTWCRDQLDAVLGSQNSVANSSTAQNQSLAGHDLLPGGALQTSPSVLKISGSTESIICQK